MTSEITTARIQARFDEFPFLKIWAAYMVGVPLIQRMDLDLLEAQSWTNAWAYGAKESDNYMCSDTDRKHVFLDASGRLVGEAKQNSLKTTYVPHKLLGIHLYDDPVETHVAGQTVLTALRLLNDPDKVAFILRICTESDGARTLTLYKVPKGKTLSQWIRKIGESAADELKNHVKAIDSV